MRKLRLSEVKRLAHVNWKTEHNSENLWAQGLSLRQGLSTHMTDTSDGTILCGGVVLCSVGCVTSSLVSAHRCQWHPALWQVIAIRKHPQAMPRLQGAKSPWLRSTGLKCLNSLKHGDHVLGGIQLWLIIHVCHRQGIAAGGPRGRGELRYKGAEYLLTPV